MISYTTPSAEQLLGARGCAREQFGWLARVERREPIILSPAERVARRLEWLRGCYMTHVPRTLREARRLVSRIIRDDERGIRRLDRAAAEWWWWREAEHGLIPIARACGFNPRTNRQWRLVLDEAARILDRAISLVGPDAPISAASDGGSDNEEEPEQNNREAQPSAPPAGAEADDSADEAEAQSAEQSGHPGGAPSAGEADGGETAEGDDPDRAEDEGAPRRATEPGPDGADGGGDTPAAGGAEPASDSEHDDAPASDDAHESAEPDLTEIGGHGTEYEVADTSYLRLRAVLRRLRGISTHRVPRATPRWDYSALVREMVSRRYALMRARRWDTVPAGVIVITDHSCSCEHVSAELEAAASALAGLRGVVVAPTAVRGDDYPEGVIMPERLYGDRALVARLRRVLRGHAWTLADWRAIRAAGITHVLVLGDVHGHRSYEAARDSGICVMWCDPNGWDESMSPADTGGMVYVPLPQCDGQDLPRVLAAAVARAIEGARA